MLWLLISFFVTTTIFYVVNLKRKEIYSSFPSMKVGKYGLEFSSKSRHRIKIGDAQLLQVQNNVYLKKDNKTVVLKNVDKLYILKGYLYFTALGKVKIIINCKSFYKYFQIKINSNCFSLEEYKTRAIQDMVNNLFDLSKAKELIYYIRIIYKTLNIKIDSEKIEIRKNAYNLPFTLTYKLNNVIKSVKVNETF